MAVQTYSSSEALEETDAPLGDSWSFHSNKGPSGETVIIDCNERMVACFLGVLKLVISNVISSRWPSYAPIAAASIPAYVRPKA